VKIDGCTALITGASAGIGREFALQLARRARHVVLVARRRERLEALRYELLKINPSLIVDIRIVDLADKSEIETLTHWIQQENIRIDLLINNAGLGDYGPFANSEPDRVDRIIQVNMSALTMLTHALLPAMISRRRGAILNVSSSAGFLPIAGFSVYAASKAYVTSFSEGLRAELRGTGVNVCALCPGPVHTEFGDVAARPGHRPASGPEVVFVAVERVVDDALAAIEQDRPVVIPGFLMKLGMSLVRLTPMPILRLASRVTAKRV
jgi:hypothetical protein